MNTEFGLIALRTPYEMAVLTMSTTIVSTIIPYLMVSLMRVYEWLVRDDGDGDLRWRW